jgi:AraC-like DNA-binding protein
MTDRLATLLEHFAPAARVFYSGRLCGTARFDDGDGDGVGHLHLVRRGDVRLLDRHGEPLPVPAPPWLAFFPRPSPHRLVAPDDGDAEVLCASVAFGGGPDGPLAASLPNPLVVPLAGDTLLGPLLALLFEEAFGERCGRQAALDRLAELLVIGLLRHVLARDDLAPAGLLAGLADPRLRKALTRIHAAPAEAWTLATMAEAAGMSRSRFAAHFVAVVGRTPADYLAGWRIGLAMVALRQGQPVKRVAQEVGYANASALARAFSARTGRSPLAWRDASTAAP